MTPQLGKTPAPALPTLQATPTDNSTTPLIATATAPGEAVLTATAIVMTTPLATARAVQSGPLPIGWWQGAGVTLWSQAGGGAIAGDVGIGYIDTVLTLDSQDRFASPGVLYPVAGGRRTPVTYQGWSDGRTMTLTVALSADNRPLATYHLNYGTPPGVRIARSGIWAGQDINLWIGDNDGIVQLQCNSGMIMQPLVLDPQGRFTGLGELEVCPTACRFYFAHYSGVTDGQTMTLTLLPVDSAEAGTAGTRYPFGTYTLTYVRAAPRTFFPTPSDCSV